MGLLQQILQKGDKKKLDLGVCIPEPEAKSEEPMQEQESGLDAIGPKGFTVSGIFHIQDSLMLQGGVSGGRIKKKDKLSFGGVTLAVKDIQVSGRSADMMLDGESGALFLKAEKGKYPMLRIGDTIEF